MRIRVRRSGMRLTVPVPFVTLLRPTVYKIVKRRAAALPALGSAEIREIRRAFRTVCREMPGFVLVEVETAAGEHLSVSL